MPEIGHRFGRYRIEENIGAGGTRVYFTPVEGPFEWNTYELPLLGGQEPQPFMPNRRTIL